MSGGEGIGGFFCLKLVAAAAACAAKCAGFGGKMLLFGLGLCGGGGGCDAGTTCGLSGGKALTPCIPIEINDIHSNYFLSLAQSFKFFQHT